MSQRKIAETFPPGEFIREELEARQWSQIDLAEIIGRHPNVVSEIVLGKRSVTPDTAKALAMAFDTSAEYWMNLQSAYQLWRTQNADEGITRRAKLYGFAPIKEMIKRNWIEPSENIEVLEQRILKFFEAKNLNETPAFPHAARKKGGITQLQLAWLFRAKHLARAVSAKTFSDSSFNEALEKLKTVRMNVEELRHVPRILAESGIRFLILEHLPHTAIDGVTFWLNSKSPVIALSLRYDRIDWFWYTLSHELGHVRSKDGLERELMLDVNIVGDQAESFEGKDEGEKKADKFASEFLVNPSELDDFILRVRPLYGKLKILGFSRRVGVHPGIVVGQLQYRGEVNWSYYRAMLERVRNVVIQSALTDGWGHKISTVM